MVDERVGLIGPAVLVLIGAAVPVPDMVVFIDMVDEWVGLTGPAVPVPDMDVFIDIVDERVGLIGPAVPVPDMVLFDDMVEERVGLIGPAVPVPDMVLFDEMVDERVRVVGAAVPAPEPVPLIVLLLPVGNGAEDDRDGPIGPAELVLVKVVVTVDWSPVMVDVITDVCAGAVTVEVMTVVTGQQGPWS